MDHLPTSDSSYDVGHPIIVSDFLVFIIWLGLSGLCGQKTRLFDQLFIVADQHASARCRDDLIAIEGKRRHLAKPPGIDPFIGSAQRFCGIFDQNSAMCFTDRADLVQLCRNAIQVDDDHCLSFRILRKCLLQRFRIHVPCFPLTVDEYDIGVLIRQRIRSRRKCQILTQYGITLSDAGQDICQMQCCCSRGQRGGVPDADIRSDFFFKLVDIFP